MTLAYEKRIEPPTKQEAEEIRVKREQAIEKLRQMVPTTCTNKWCLLACFHKALIQILRNSTLSSHTTARAS